MATIEEVTDETVTAGAGAEERKDGVEDEAGQGETYTLRSVPCPLQVQTERRLREAWTRWCVEFECCDEREMKPFHETKLWE